MFIIKLVSCYIPTEGKLVHSHKTVTQTTQSVSDSLDDDSPESLFSLLSPESLESLESFESLPLSDDESSEPDPCNENTNEMALSPGLVCIYCTE